MASHLIRKLAQMVQRHRLGLNLTNGSNLAVCLAERIIWCRIIDAMTLYLVPSWRYAIPGETEESYSYALQPVTAGVVS